MRDDGSLDILILGLNYAPEMVGIAVYTTGLAEALVASGHRVEVVAGNPYYPAWHVPDAYRRGARRRTMENGVVVTRVAHYVPAKPSGLRRLVHHISFALSAALPLLRTARKTKPDLVMAVAPSLIAAPVALMVSRLVGARSWIHIQDFEIEAAAATGLLRQGLLLRFAARLEAVLLSCFDRVSSISPAMCRRCRAKGVPDSKIIELRNWADIEGIRPLVTPSTYRADWGLSTPHVALYSGNIANKQGIEIVVEAASRLRHRQDLTFVICGEGPNRASLEGRAAGFGNIVFHNLQPKERLGDLLGLATVHLLPQIAGAADLVLPSKLANMLASGRPVVATADQKTSLEIEVSGCGLVVPPDDIEAFTAAIEHVIDHPEAAAEWGQEARQRAETRWDRSAIIRGFLSDAVRLMLDRKTSCS